MKKTQFIKDLKKDDLVNDIFVVKFKKPVDKYKNGYKFELRLGDSSKEIMFKLWGPSDEQEVQKVFSLIKPDDFVHIQGRVNDWNGVLEISSSDLKQIKVVPKEQIDLNDFVPTTKKDIEKMFSELMGFVNNIKNPDLKKFLDDFFNDITFVKQFKQSPAAMYKHHGWVGGLLEHTLNVVLICADALKIHSNLDKDLVITGAIIHDFGKIEEFTITTSIKTSTKGMLLGHIAIGYEKISQKLEQLDINEDMKLKIKHMLLSHHGNLEYGSPKLPAFPEALLIYYADELDAKVHLMQKLKEEASTEDDYVFTKDFGNIYLR